MPCLEVLEDRTLPSVTPVAVASPVADSNHISPDLLSLYQQTTGQGNPTNPAGTDNLLQFDKQGRIDVDVTASDVTAVLPGLQSLGFQVVASIPQDHLIEGFLPVSAIASIGQLVPNGLLGVLPAYKSATAAGLVDSEGDNVLEADRVRASVPGYDGTGVKVGILSDSYNARGGAATDIANGDLPANGVTVLQDDPFAGGTDEGRAMLQIVHDVAPGAALGFATAATGQAGFAQNIENLADPNQFGANVIGDDVFYFAEPFFQEGVIGQAIDKVVGQGVSYFALAGNLQDQAYESTNVSFLSDTIAGISNSAQNFYNFGNSTDKQQVTLQNGQKALLSLQWDQPFYTASGVKTDLNFYILDDSTGQVVASSTTDNVATQTPLQLLQFQNNTGAAHVYDVVIEKANNGPDPGRIKYVNYGANNFGPMTFDNFATHSPTLIPHAGDPNAVAVAAAPFFDQRNPESYTSLGPATFLFDSGGNRLATPLVVNKPDVTAIDGVSTSFFENTNFEPNGFPTFFGTSAATPHAAAVAALVLQANPGFTPAQVYSRLENTADPNIGGTPGNANLVGHGLIDAYRAIYPNGPTPATPNFFDGFESGVLGAEWETYTSGAGRIQVVKGNGPAHGNFDLTMDSSLNNFLTPELDEAILHINATNSPDLVLQFNQKNKNSSGDAITPLPNGPFTGHVGADGVSLSVDGVHWFPLLSLDGNNTSSSYLPHTINLGAVAAADGLTLGADVRIKFQHYDNNSFEFNGSSQPGGVVFDDVSVTRAAKVTAVSVQWGKQDSGPLVTAADGVRLLPAGRNTDLPWLGINRLVLTFDQAVALTPADLTVVGVRGGDYGPATVGQVGNSNSYVVTLARAITGPDRVTLTVGNNTDALAPYSRRLDVLPGDVSDNGVVDSPDLNVFAQRGHPNFGDINGDGLVDFQDLAAVSSRLRTRLP